MSDKIKEAKKQIKLREKAKVVQKEKNKLKKLKENGKAITKELEKDYPLINFQKLSETSDFKRLIYLAITGETWRGTNKNLEKILSKKLINVQE
ncbi:hypothetical protein ES702_03512 [subsurface metagenome]